MNEDVKLAKDIDDCSNCPLFENNCSGGWQCYGGAPIEPPCCNWNDDTEVYSGMYYYEPSEKEIQWEREYIERKEKESIERKEQQAKDDALWQLKEWSKYPNVKTRRSSCELSTDWLCPRCHNWFVDNYQWKDKLIFKSYCPICNTPLGHSYCLD